MKSNIIKGSTARKIIIGGVSGIAIGASSMTYAGNEMIENSAEDAPDSDGGYEDLSFGDAFDAARQDMGPGGTFEWHGQTYSTSTTEEWEAAHPSEPLAEEVEMMPEENVEMEEDEADSEEDEVEILDSEDEQDGEIEAEIETGNDINGDDAAFVEVAEQVQTDAVEDVYVGQDADGVCDTSDDFANDDVPMM